MELLKFIYFHKNYNVCFNQTPPRTYKNKHDALTYTMACCLFEFYGI